MTESMNVQATTATLTHDTTTLAGVTFADHEYDEADDRDGDEVEADDADVEAEGLEAALIREEGNLRIETYLGRHEDALRLAWGRNELEGHAFANIFPWASDAKLQEIVDDIERHGYDETQPIVMYERKILDGRNRAKAALLVYERHKESPAANRYMPRFAIAKGTAAAALAYVKSRNLARRQLSASEAALVASDLHDQLVALRRTVKVPPVGGSRSVGEAEDFDTDEYSGEPDEEYGSNDEEYGSDDDAPSFGDVGPIADGLSGRSSAAAAAMVDGASERNVQRINRLKSREATEALGKKRQKQILEAIRTRTLTARAGEEELLSAIQAKAAAKAKAQAEEAAAKLTSRPDEQWPGKPVLVASGAARLQLVDALELLRAVEPHTAATIVLDPPPPSATVEPWKREREVHDLLRGVEHALAPGGDLWLVLDRHTLQPYLAALHTADPDDTQWRTRKILAWDGPGSGDDVWSGETNFVVWLTRARDRQPRNLEGVGKILSLDGTRTLLDVGSTGPEETRHGAHPQQRPERLYEGLLAVGSGLVLVPFAGTGAAMVAAVRLGRAVVGGDIVQDYLAVGRLRLAQALTDMGEHVELDEEPQQNLFDRTPTPVTPLLPPERSPEDTARHYLAVDEARVTQTIADAAEHLDKVAREASVQLARELLDHSVRDFAAVLEEALPDWPTIRAAIDLEETGRKRKKVLQALIAERDKFEACLEDMSEADRERVLAHALDRSLNPDEAREAIEPEQPTRDANHDAAKDDTLPEASDSAHRTTEARKSGGRKRKGKKAPPKTGATAKPTKPAATKKKRSAKKAPKRKGKKK